MDFQQVYKLIKNLIIQIKTTDYLDSDIRQAFQAPTSDKFITYEILDQRRCNIKGAHWFSETEDNMSSNVLTALSVQLDYWSDKLYASQNNATRMHAYLSEVAPYYLRDNYPTFGIGIVEDVRNLTDTGDKAEYLFRYCLRFELFGQNIITTPMQFFDEINVDLDLIA